MNKTEDREADYRPISCDVYSEFELAIIRRQPLRLAWQAGDVCVVARVLPLDLETRRGQEFLHCRLPSGERARIRLDYIARMERA